MHEERCADKFVVVVFSRYFICIVPHCGSLEALLDSDLRQARRVVTCRNVGRELVNTKTPLAIIRLPDYKEDISSESRRLIHSANTSPQYLSETHLDRE